MKFKDAFTKQNIKLNCPSVTHDVAIEQAGRFLMELGYVNSSYIESMKEREAVISTFVGHGTAIPHGLAYDPNMVHKSGVVLLQYPEGINYHGKRCYLIIGISSTKEDHLEILSHIAFVLGNEKTAAMLWSSTSVDKVYNTFIKEKSV